MTNLSLKQIKDVLHMDTISRKDDVVTVRRSFFYRHGCDTGVIIERIKSIFPTAIIMEAEENWKPFRGGASVAAGSHWMVKFKLSSEVKS
jgi:hypothetical protein